MSLSRRKGEITARMNERDYPHLVELPLPPGGFRSTSEDMLAFHRERGIQSRRGRGRNDEGQFFVTFCFGDPTHADAFRDRFGGERLTFQSIGGCANPISLLASRPRLIEPLRYAAPAGPPGPASQLVGADKFL